ncbi:hypothetical protein CRP01_21940 [Flavilitoribacter nigricans DSM 23189 = NBRC 102662]|uniref:Uncharacterized protein n=1 Tax=Flavilitoribacter nigricans (strain ATCC 23147 / DSM 23189 / NBRC 102662 / NCIMB 1420 / SS-2) TaxID=1122177 RepID=A0A2D0N6V9_FLAN2|nr:hypothetical protein CRP01_21940 [Flavilitoribacter nigricans DSM 23189 = NBRC 102662]
MDKHKTGFSVLKIKYSFQLRVSLLRPTYQSRTYRKFKSIHPESHREIIRFYDENEQSILKLDFEEYFDLLVAYVNALFVIGKYRQHLLMVDLVIEYTIQRNIFSYNGQDLFFEMLTCKGLSHLHTYDYVKAENIFKQLIRIKPEEEDSVKYLEKSIRVAGDRIQHWSRAISIGMLFLAAIVIGVEILLIRPFYEMHVWYFELGRTLLFIFACMAMAGGEWLHWYRSRKKAGHFLRQVKARKNNTPA